MQQTLHLPSELAMEQWVMRHDLLAHLTVWYYASLHVPSLIAFLIWLWFRHPEAYPRWRNALAVATGGCLFIRFIRVAPPRLLPDLGFVDLPAELGRDIYGPIGTGASDQFAAMPSIHVAWAVVVGDVCGRGPDAAALTGLVRHTLRTVVVQDRKAYVQAGAGIVADSVPELEYQETLNKARGLLKAIEATQRRTAEAS